jgi:hypothetical protein
MLGSKELLKDNSFGFLEITRSSNVHLCILSHNRYALSQIWYIFVLFSSKVIAWAGICSDGVLLPPFL